MGTPVKILDVARRFSQTADPPLQIVFTGLRPGEKMSEDLLASDETDDRPVHPLISHIVVPPLALSERERELGRSDATVVESMQRLSASPVEQSVA
jgi:FlaA1/EpsC-like NDP-sugar epimerase